MGVLVASSRLNYIVEFVPSVGLARLLFPEEAKVAMEIAGVDSTTELISRETLDSNEAPFIIKEEHHQRIRALDNAVTLGKRFFPRCSQVLDWLVDTNFDDLTDLVNMGSNTHDERLVKKQRFMQLQEMQSKAFTEDVEANRRSRGSASSSVPIGGKHRLGRFTRNESDLAYTWDEEIEGRVSV